MSDVEEMFNRRGVTDVGDPVGAFEAPDLSPEDYAEHTAQTMAKILESTGLFETVEVHASVGQIHLLGRVQTSNEKKFVDSVVKQALLAMEKTCDGFIGKQYMIRRGKVLYGWCFSFGAEDLKGAARNIAEAIEAMAPPRREIVEVPLVGPPPPQSGGRGSGKRGAHPVR